MEEFIKNLLDQYNYDYVNIDTKDSLIKIHNLLINNIIFEPLTSIELLYLAIYYREISQNYELMKKYYLMAIDKGNSDAMNNLGYYYDKIEENYDLMKKYYLMAIEKRNYDAAKNLLKYYIKNSNENIYDEDFLNFINIENEELQKLDY